MRFCTSEFIFKFNSGQNSIQGSCKVMKAPFFKASLYKVSVAEYLVSPTTDLGYTHNCNSLSFKPLSKIFQFDLNFLKAFALILDVIFKNGKEKFKCL